MGSVDGQKPVLNLANHTPEEWAAWVSFYRGWLGLTRENLARQARCSVATIKFIETGYPATKRTKRTKRKVSTSHRVKLSIIHALTARIDSADTQVNVIEQ